MLKRDFLAFACFASPLDQLVQDALSALSPERSVSLLTTLRLPSQPYNSSDMSAVVWAPSQRPESTAFMACFRDGWATLVHILATRFGHDCAKVRLSTSEVEWPIVELLVYEGGDERCLVRAMRDAPRWEFFERGTPLDFEEKGAYSRRLVRDRFTAEMLWSYLSVLGWAPNDEAFWRTEHTAFELHRGASNKPRQAARA